MNAERPGERTLTRIESRANPRLKRWRRLLAGGDARRVEGRAVLAGEHLAEAALCSRAILRAALVDETSRPALERSGLFERLPAECELFSVRHELFASVAVGFEAARVLVEFDPPVVPAGPVAAPALFLDGIQDPGNIGTIIRTAAAFGIRDLVAGGECADLWSGKVLRASMGGHFALRLRAVPDLAPVLLSFAGLRVATMVSEGDELARIDLRRPVGWLFGAEGRGVSPRLAALADLRVRIPIAGVESLNVAAAAAICLYEAARQVAGGTSS